MGTNQWNRASDRMNAMPLDRGDGDPRSDAAQAEYGENWNECAAFINAEPSEIGMFNSLPFIIDPVNLCSPSVLCQPSDHPQLL